MWAEVTRAMSSVGPLKHLLLLIKTKQKKAQNTFRRMEPEDIRSCVLEFIHGAKPLPQSTVHSASCWALLQFINQSFFPSCDSRERVQEVFDESFNSSSNKPLGEGSHNHSSEALLALPVALPSRIELYQVTWHILMKWSVHLNYSQTLMSLAKTVKGGCAELPVATPLNTETVIFPSWRKCWQLIACICIFLKKWLLGEYIHFT